MKTMKRTLASLLSLLLIVLPMMPAQAAMVGTDQLIAAQAASDVRTSLKSVLNSDAARDQLQLLGVNPADVDARIDSLTDAELARIDQQIGNLESGEGILGIILIVFIVFVITDVLGATDIFPFIHPIER